MYLNLFLYSKGREALGSGSAMTLHYRQKFYDTSEKFLIISKTFIMVYT